MKYNIHTLYSLSLQIHAHIYSIEHIQNFKIKKKKRYADTFHTHTYRTHPYCNVHILSIETNNKIK